MERTEGDLDLSDRRVNQRVRREKGRGTDGHSNERLRVENEGVHKQFSVLMNENEYLREQREKAAAIADAPIAASPDAVTTINELRKVVSFLRDLPDI